MNITRDVVNDLLPAYLSGEATADTRALVEEFLASDPELARTVSKYRTGASNDVQFFPGGDMPLSADHELRTLQQTRTALQRQRWLFALALAFTLVPVSFAFDGTHMSWMMIRDVPRIGMLYWGLAAAFWTAFAVTRR